MEKITVPARIENLYTVLEFVDGVLKESGAGESVHNNAAIVAEEVFVNIVNYSGSGEAEIRAEIADNKLTLEFRDTGTPYNPLAQKDPDISLPAEERGIGGLGIYMVKNMMDSVSYKYEDKTNILTLEKNLNGGKNANK